MVFVKFKFNHDLLYTIKTDLTYFVDYLSCTQIHRTQIILKSLHSSLHIKSIMIMMKTIKIFKAICKQKIYFFFLNIFNDLKSLHFELKSGLRKMDH